MTTTNTAGAPSLSPDTNPQGKAFDLSAAIDLPVRGKRLTVAFTAAVTYGDKPTG
jgi:hypothetical protein